MQKRAGITSTQTLSGLWLLEQVWLFLRYDGVKVVFDSHRYLDGALHWDAFSPFYAYSAMISPFAHLDFLLGISLLQITLNLAAFWAYLQLLRHFNVQGPVFFLGGLLFLWPELQLWNYFIHCESLYISFATLGLWAVTTKRWVHAGGWFFLLTVLRPNGFLFPLAWAMSVALSCWQPKKTLLMGSAVLLVLIWICMDVVIPRLNNFPFWYHLTSGFIITGVDTWSVDNSALTYCEECTSNMLKTLSLVVQNPLFYLQFWMGRIVIWLTQVRPYYPAYHNILVVLLFIPVYAMALYRGWHSTWKQNMLWILPILLQAGVVVIAGVDWDNRYLVIVMPCLFVLAALGADRFYRTVIQKDKR